MKISRKYESSPCKEKIYKLSFTYIGGKMNEEKPGINWKRIIITTAFVLLSAAIVGGTTWYIMDKNANDIKASNDKSVSELQKQIDELKTAKADTLATPTTTAVDKTAGWKTYTNNDLKISFKYPTNYTLSDMSSAWISSDENQSPWYYRPDYAKLVLLLKASAADQFTFTVENTTDDTKIRSAGGWESNIKQSEKMINGNKVIIYSIDGNKPMYAVIHDGKAYVFQGLTVTEDMIRTLNFS
jgi:hypothetical protein